MNPVMQPQYRTVAAGGLAGAIMTIVAAALHHWNIVLSPEVIEASTFLITSAAAWLVHPKAANSPAAAPEQEKPA